MKPQIRRTYRGGVLRRYTRAKPAKPAEALGFDRNGGGILGETSSAGETTEIEWVQRCNGVTTETRGKGGSTLHLSTWGAATSEMFPIVPPIFIITSLQAYKKPNESAGFECNDPPYRPKTEVVTRYAVDTAPSSPRRPALRIRFLADADRGLKMRKAHHRPQPRKAGAISTRQLTRLLRKKGSDHCHGCRRPYQHLDSSHVGYDAAGRLLQVGDCCISRLKSFCAISAGVAPDAPTPWSEDDRQWFEAHPNRSHRLRRSYPGEFPERVEHAVVRQVAPGRRVRAGLTVPAPLPQDEAPEAAAWAIFDVVADSIQKDREVTVDEILARWAILENEARA